MYRAKKRFRNLAIVKVKAVEEKGKIQKVVRPVFDYFKTC